MNSPPHAARTKTNAGGSPPPQKAGESQCSDSSGVYNQSWIPGATEFLRANSAALAARPVWLFSVGSFGDTHRGIGKLMRSCVLCRR